MLSEVAIGTGLPVTAIIKYLLGWHLPLVGGP